MMARIERVVFIRLLRSNVCTPHPVAKTHHQSDADIPVCKSDGLKIPTDRNVCITLKTNKTLPNSFFYALMSYFEGLVELFTGQFLMARSCL